jgi:hypothetical protein
MEPRTPSRTVLLAAGCGGCRLLPLLLILASLPACAPAVSHSSARVHVRATLHEQAGVHRWAAGPLVVRVEGLTAADSAAVYHAFAAWLEGPRPPLVVRAARGSEAADVEVRGVDRVERGQDATGRTELEWTGATLTRARVELARTSRCGQRLTTLERRRAIVHEVGHVLGLGHSDRFTSIMHRHTPGRDVDETDRHALRLLYDLPLTTSPAAVLASGDGER